MPRETYNDRRRYDDDGRDGRPYRRRDEHARDDRQSGSRNHRETSRGEDSTAYPREMKVSTRDERQGASSSSQVSRPRRKSSRSPDFKRDRAREREAYDRGRGTRSREREEEEQQQEQQKNEAVFETSGLLAKESNSKNGVALKYAEPPEARMPKKKWRLYVFKDGKEIGELLCVEKASGMTSSV